MSGTNSLQLDGIASALRLYDVGYEIDLEHVARLLGADVRGRDRPARLEGRAFEIRQPPVLAALGERRVPVRGGSLSGRLSARVFDFGVCSLRLAVPVADRSAWSRLTALGAELDSTELAEFFRRELDAFLTRVRPAIDRPEVADVSEDYIVYRVSALYEDGQRCDARAVLTDDHLARLLLGEQHALSPAARQELLGARFSYYTDDLAVLTWDNALIVEPRESDTDVEYVLEFANAQLLDLRVYDAQLDQELPSLYDRIAAARRRLLTGRFRAVLAEVQTRVADVTEIVERADNALKVTDDVYLARIYEKALEIFREKNWRAGIDRKLRIFRDTYSMLNDETQTTRSELLELAIIALIMFEIVLTFVR